MTEKPRLFERGSIGDDVGAKAIGRRERRPGLALNAIKLERRALDAIKLGQSETTVPAEEAGKHINIAVPTRGRQRRRRAREASTV